MILNEPIDMDHMNLGQMHVVECGANGIYRILVE